MRYVIMNGVVGCDHECAEFLKEHGQVPYKCWCVVCGREGTTEVPDCHDRIACTFSYIFMGDEE